VKRSLVLSRAKELLRLPRLRAGTPACTKRFGEGRDYGVQARTFQVLAMTEWEKGFIL
jgi:hypothetical protein